MPCRRHRSGWNGLVLAVVVEIALKLPIAQILRRAIRGPAPENPGMLIHSVVEAEATEPLQAFGFAGSILCYGETGMVLGRETKVSWRRRLPKVN